MLNRFINNAAELKVIRIAFSFILMGFHSVPIAEFNVYNLLAHSYKMLLGDWTGYAGE